MDFMTIKFEFKFYIKDSLIFVFDMHAKIATQLLHA